jgi:hypothetical protein
MTSDDEDEEDGNVPLATKEEALLLDDYDEEASAPHTIAESKAKEDAKWSSEEGLDDVIPLSALVAGHHTPLLLPLPLVPHASLHAEWQG